MTGSVSLGLDHILKDVSSIFVHTANVTGVQCCFGLPLYRKYLVTHKKKKSVIQVWNDEVNDENCNF